MSEAMKNVYLEAFQEMSALIRLVLETQGSFHVDSDGWTRASERFSDRYRTALDDVAKLAAEAGTEGLTERQAASLVQRARGLRKIIAETSEGNQIQMRKDRQQRHESSAAEERLKAAKRDHPDFNGITIDYQPVEDLLNRASQLAEQGNDLAAQRRYGKVHDAIRNCAGRARAAYYRNQLDVLRQEVGERVDMTDVLSLLERSEACLKQNNGEGAGSTAKKAFKLLQRKAKALKPRAMRWHA